MPAKPIPPEVRFMRFVKEDENGCWIWTGHTTGSKGKRGFFQPGTRSTDPKMYAHIFAYRTWVGPIPEGMELDHVICNNGMCVNPWHLEPVPPRINQERTRRDFCLAGHDMSDPNNQKWAIGVDGLPKRKGCRECAKIRDRVRYHEKKGRD